MRAPVLSRSPSGVKAAPRGWAERPTGAFARLLRNKAPQPKDTGDLRLLARGRCKRGQERPIRWAKQGPPGNPGQPGVPGAPGPKGDTGEQGPRGAAGATDVVVRTADSTAGTLANTSEIVTANCKPGEVAVGGGGSPLNVSNSNMVFMKTRPSPNNEGETPTAWEATIVTEIGDPDGFARAYVVCASP